MSAPAGTLAGNALVLCYPQYQLVGNALLPAQYQLVGNALLPAQYQLVGNALLPARYQLVGDALLPTVLPAHGCLNPAALLQQCVTGWCHPTGLNHFA
jgi:hemoglobin-like flavoprotein